MRETLPDKSPDDFYDLYEDAVFNSPSGEVAEEDRWGGKET